MLLTIAIVAYKHEYFEESLVSVLNQTYKDFVLNILDDSPRGEIKKIADKYAKDPRLRYIKNEKNLGEHNNILKAINICQTKYLWIFHDDDIAYPALAEKEVAILEAFPDVAMVSCNYEIIDEYGVSHEKTDIHSNYKGGPNPNNYIIFEKNELLKNRQKGAFLNTPAKIYRMEALKNIDLKSWKYLDTYLEFLMNEYGKAALAEECLLKYRLHPGQGSANNQIIAYKHLIKYCMPIVERALSEEDYAEARAETMFHLLSFETEKRFKEHFKAGEDYILEQLFVLNMQKQLSRETNLKYLLYFGKKMRMLKDRFPAGRREDYIIWGAGGSGSVTYEILTAAIPAMNCIGFIDKRKQGEFYGLPIYNPDEFCYYKKTFVMICTTPGAAEAYNALTGGGYKEFEDFFYGYGFNF